MIVGLSRVLVVEDSPEDRFLIRRYLGRLGVADIVEADAVARAIEVAAAGGVDGLVVDLDLPDAHELDGLERLVEAVGRDRVPVVVLTGSGDSGLAVRTLDAGAHDFLVKGALTEGELWRALVNATAKSRLARALAEQREWSQSTLASISDGVIATDLDCLVTFLNPEAERLTGWTEAEAKGRPAADVANVLTSPDRRPAPMYVAEVCVGAAARASVESLLVATREGRDTPVDVRVAPIRDRASRVVGAVLLLRDVTERRLLEEERAALLERERAAREAAEAATQAKDEFLAALSHELRTPLNAILGWTTILGRNTGDEATVRRAVETIDRNVRTQSQLIEDVLDVSRIISGKLRLNVQPLEISGVVLAAVDTVQPAADAKGIALAVEADGDATVVGDPDRLQQVIWNLLSNAIKFTPKGGGVTVSIGRDDDRAVVAVRDTGPGIDAALLPHVFDRYWQAEGGTTRRHGGLGLGLAIVRNLVELHGGEIAAANVAEGTGALFTLSLPVLGARAPSRELAPEAARAASASPSERDLAGVRVLVVDDEPDTSEAVRYILEGAGAEVTVASSAREAVRAVEASTPDVIVSDIGMPGEDGYSLIRRVRAMPGGLGRAIPAVAVTAYARSEDRVRALDAGFQMHVPKPIEPDELVAVVASLAGLTLKGEAAPERASRRSESV